MPYTLKSMINNTFESNDLNVGKQYSMTSSIYNDNDITIDVLREYQDKFSHNRVLFTINSIILTVTHFCKTTFYILYNLKNQDNIVIITEYIRRYKAFVDYAIFFNEEMENFNVIVNYLYDYFFKNKPIPSKFSLIRLFVSYNNIITILDNNLE